MRFLFFVNLNINQNVTEAGNENIDIKSQLEHKIQSQETKDRGWIFGEIFSKRTNFVKTGDLKGARYVKIPLRSNAILRIENKDRYCFSWSFLACENDHPSRVRTYRQSFIEISIQSFDFLNGFKCSDVHKFEKTNRMSIDNFELNFYQDQSK